MLKIIPKSKDQAEDNLIFSEGSSDYYLPVGNRLEYLFYSEIQVNKNNELFQIGNILDIDLSIFFIRPKYQYASDYFSLLCDLEVIDDKNSSQAKVIKQAICKSKEEFKHLYFSTNEGWAEITKMKTVIKKLLNKIFEQPNYHQQIKYNLEWGKYFYIDEPEMNDPEKEKQREADREYLRKIAMAKIKEDAEKYPQKTARSLSEFIKKIIRKNKKCIVKKKVVKGFIKTFLFFWKS